MKMLTRTNRISYGDRFLILVNLGALVLVAGMFKYSFYLFALLTVINGIVVGLEAGKRGKIRYPIGLIGGTIVIGSFWMTPYSFAFRPERWLVTFWYAYTLGSIIAGLVEKDAGAKRFLAIAGALCLAGHAAWGIGYFLLVRSEMQIEVGAYGDFTRQKFVVTGDEETGLEYIRHFRVQNPIVESANFSAVLIACGSLALLQLRLITRLFYVCLAMVGLFLALYVLLRQSIFAGVVVSILVFIVGIRSGKVSAGTILLSISIGGLALAIGAFAMWDRIVVLGSRFEGVREEARIEIYREALANIIAEPMGGGKLRMTKIFSAHNGLLEAGLIFGWFGVLGYLGMSVGWALVWIRLWKRRLLPQCEGLLTILVIGFVSWVIMLVDNPTPYRIAASLVGLFGSLAILDGDKKMRPEHRSQRAVSSYANSEGPRRAVVRSDRI